MSAGSKSDHTLVWVQGSEPLHGFWHTWSSGPVHQWNWEHSCACKGPSHPPPPSPLHCPCRCGEDGSFFSWIPCAVWSMTCRARFHYLAGHPSQKRAPNYTPFLSFCWGKVGRDAYHPLPPPSLPPPQPSEAVPRSPVCMEPVRYKAFSDECLLLELWPCLSGMMQPRKNVKHLS